jgi:hypothetical protein
MRSYIAAITFFTTLSLAASAQSYSFETVNKQKYVFSDRNVKDMHLRVKNNTPAKIDIKWKVMTMLDTNKWGRFAFCDPSQCITYLQPGDENQTEISASGLGDFKLSVMAKPTALRDSFVITFWQTSNPSVIDTITYVLDAQALGLADNIAAKPFSFFPNPASDHVTIDIPGEKTITVYTMTRQEIISEKISGNVFTIETLEAGAYILEVRNSREVFRARLLKN